MNQLDSNLNNLTFQYGWIKPLSISLAGKVFNSKVVFQASRQEEITEKQQKSFKEFYENYDDFIEEINTLLTLYIKDNSIENPEVNLTALLFKRNGDFAALFDCNWDSENGIAVILKPNKKVGIQDLFL